MRSGRAFLFMAQRPRGKTLIQQSRGVPSAEKARWHELDGAGKRGIKREFFGLNATDEEAIAQRISDGIERQLKE
jgi:hypothetical protein